MYQAIQPVLLGADLNCYSMARAFFAATGRRAIVYGQSALGPIRYSRYLRFTAVPGLGRKEVLLPLLLGLGKSLPQGVTAMLLPGTDEYARLLIEEEDSLSRFFLLPQPPKSALPLFEKSWFYRRCEAYGIPYPTTLCLAAMPTRAALLRAGEQLGYPFIIKPSSSVSYWHHPFAGMKKVYLVQDAAAAEGVLSAIFSSGYPGTVLLQRYLAGGDAVGHVLTLYFDSGGTPRLRACGRVLLEEHTPRGRGNYAALLTAPIPAVAEPLCRMLSEIGYRGFANFDLRYEAREGRFYVLELNLRLGRSHYFLTAGGQNPAAWLVRDYGYGEPLFAVDLQKELLFRTVPYAVVRHYTAAAADAALAARLHREGKEACPLYDTADLCHPLRALYVAAHMQREKKKFARYCVRAR